MAAPKFSRKGRDQEMDRDWRFEVWDLPTKTRSHRRPLVHQGQYVTIIFNLIYSQSHNIQNYKTFSLANQSHDDKRKAWFQIWGPAPKRPICRVHTSSLRIRSQLTFSPGPCRGLSWEGRCKWHGHDGHEAVSPCLQLLNADRRVQKSDAAAKCCQDWGLKDNTCSLALDDIGIFSETRLNPDADECCRVSLVAYFWAASDTKRSKSIPLCEWECPWMSLVSCKSAIGRKDLPGRFDMHGYALKSNPVGLIIWFSMHTLMHFHTVFSCSNVFDRHCFDTGMYVWISHLHVWIYILFLICFSYAIVCVII